MKAIEEQILRSPRDEDLWQEYISVLEKKDQRKAEILKLSRSELSAKGLIRLGELIHDETDKHWIAQFETFRGLIGNFREVEVPVSHYGRAPQRYGSGVYSIILPKFRTAS